MIVFHLEVFQNLATLFAKCFKLISLAFSIQDLGVGYYFLDLAWGYFELLLGKKVFDYCRGD